MFPLLFQYVQFSKGSLGLTIQQTNGQRLEYLVSFVVTSMELTYWVISTRVDFWYQCCHFLIQHY